MKAIETTATFEGPDRLLLKEPVAEFGSGNVRVIVFVDEKASQPVDFRAAIGSYYRDFPNETPRDSDQWLKDLRDGESDGLGR